MNNSKLENKSTTTLAHTARRRKSRDLGTAATLRPAEIYALYGIPTSTLSGYCNNPDAASRLPSRLIPGRCGRKGARYVDHADLKLWLDRWRVAA